MNELTPEASFCPTEVVDGDVETNLVAYDDGNLKHPDSWSPFRPPMCTGMRVVLTRTVPKEVDFFQRDGWHCAIVVFEIQSHPRTRKN